MPTGKRIFALLLLCGALCGCVSTASANETQPVINYIEETTTTSSVLTAVTTKGVTAELITSETTAEITTEATTAETTTETTTTTEAAETSDRAVQTTTVPESKPVTSAVTSARPAVYTNTITLNGPNLVYTGESFDYTYKISHRNADRASVLWQINGNAGTITEDGKFTATQAGTAVLTVSDISNGLTDTLLVHVVDSPEDVDFVVEVNGIPIANKTYPVPKDYHPGLLSETYDAFLELKLAALNDGIEINFMSGFRSYEEQTEVYANWNKVYSDGQADRVSARPGHSEHQLGLAIDVNSIEFSFADTPEGLWLAENCWKYGFIIRYKEGTEEITGYMYEPWHIRYLGKELAKDVHFSGLTLEEYLGIDSWYRIEEYTINTEE